MVTESRPRRRSAPSLSQLAPVSPFSAVVALAAAFALVLVLWLLTDFELFLLLLVALAVAGTDRVVRMHPQARFHGATATLLYLFVPGLYALGVGAALAELESLPWKLLLTAALSLVFLITVRMEYLTVDPEAGQYELARSLLMFVIYITAYLLFVVAFASGLPLVVSIVLVGATAFLLTVDMLRELEPDATALWTQCATVAVVLGECRLALYFLPLADVLAGAFLFIAFYAVTGLVQAHASGRLDRRTWLQFACFVALDFLIILIARLFQA